MIELEIVGGIAEGKHIKTNVPFLSVGRAAEHTIVIDDPFVSRHHGEIMLIDSGYQYRDLNSTHGTILHRHGEQDYIRQVILRSGDELSFGGAENLLRIIGLESADLEQDDEDRSDPSITRMHIQADRFAPPEDLYANDSNALRTMVGFDSRIIESNLTTERQLFRALLEHIPLLFDHTIYVAIIERADGALRAFDYELVDASAKVRLSSTITSMSDDVKRGIVFNVDREEEVVSGDRQAKLSQNSRILSGATKQKNTGRSGICIPIRVQGSPLRYLQFERNNLYGAFRPRNVGLVSSLAMRASHRLENIDLVQKNQRLNHAASLGVFAGMIGHDIKNYLFYSKKLSDIQDDPLSAHPAIAKGIERSRKLAQSMKELANPGKMTVKAFSLRDMITSMTAEFTSLFGEQCDFDAEIADDIDEITTNDDLLMRVIWNLVMNSYHAFENRPKSVLAKPEVRVEADANNGQIRIRVSDNAGGIGPKTFEYIQRSFELIRSAYVAQEDLIDIVSEISAMHGFTNSIGLFFTAAATNNMAGTILVKTKQNEGSVFTVEIPANIDRLRNLLVF